VLQEALGNDVEKAEVIDDFREAIDRGLSLTTREDLLCITGSLYTVGEAEAYFHPGGGA
jgi:folylpolyglutamate synthase/dihydropteroate synthase